MTSKKGVFLSIIIPSRNSQKTLKKTLTSVFKSNFSRPFEVIVVDDKSNDTSPEIAKKFPISLFVNKTNSGPAFSRNFGAKKAQGKLLLFLDADVILKKNTIKNLVNFYQKNKTQGKECICGGYFEKKSLTKDFGAELTALHGNYLFQKNAVKHRLNSILPEDSFPSFCGLISKKIFGEIGMFDKRFKIAGGEEHDLGFRLRQKGIPIFILLNCPVAHHFRPFLRMLKAHFQRGVNYLINDKRYPFKKSCYGVNESEAINFLLSFLTIFFLLAAIVFPKLIFLGLLFLPLHLFFYWRFYFQIFREKGLFFLLKAIPTMQIIYLTKFFAATTALILIYIFKRQNNVF